VGVSRDCPNFDYPLSGTGIATNFKFSRDIHRVHPNKSPLKIWEKRVRGRIQGLSKFLEYSLLSQDRVKLRTSNLAATFTHRVHPNKSPLKTLGKKSVGVSINCRNFSSTPYYLRTSNFVRTFLVSIGTRAHYKFREKYSRQRRVVRILKVFQGTHILGASRGRLCDSSAFLFSLSSPTATRQLSYRKEDRAMRPIYGCPEKFRESSLSTQLVFQKFVTGYCSDR